MKPSCLILSLVLSFVSLAWAVEATQDDYGAPAVEVRQEDGRWVVQGRRSRVEVNPSDLQMTLGAGGRTWSTIASAAGDLIVEADGKTYALRLACLLYTSDAADDLLCVDLGGRRIIKNNNINMYHSTLSTRYYTSLQLVITSPCY